jgi:dephospho-CoA kinase
MPGTGKSAVIHELRQRGYKAYDADEGGLSEMREMPGLPGEQPGPEWVWREDRIDDLLSAHGEGEVLVLSGCASNQGQFYPRFDHIVLLTAPDDVIVERLTTRTTNDYGKSPEQRAKALYNKRVVEPMLRKRATAEIDTSAPLAEVVEEILGLLNPR